MFIQKLGSDYLASELTYWTIQNARNCTLWEFLETFKSTARNIF